MNLEKNRKNVQDHDIHTIIFNIYYKYNFLL